MKGVKGTCGSMTFDEGIEAVCELLRTKNCELTTRQVVQELSGSLTENQVNASLKHAAEAEKIEYRRYEQFRIAWRAKGSPTTIKPKPNPYMHHQRVTQQSAYGDASAYGNPLSVQGHEMETGESDIAGGMSSASNGAYIPRRLKTPNELTPLQSTTIEAMLSLSSPCKVEHIAGSCSLKIAQIQQAIKLLRDRGMIRVDDDRRGRALAYFVTDAGKAAYAAMVRRRFRRSRRRDI